MENDKDGAHQRIIREALVRQEGVELLVLNRTISVERNFLCKLAVQDEQAAPLEGFVVLSQSP